MPSFLGPQEVDRVEGSRGIELEPMLSLEVSPEVGGKKCQALNISWPALSSPHSEGI